MMTTNDVYDTTIRRDKNGSSLPTSEFNDNPPTIKKISKFREALPQICAVSAKNLLLVTFGTTLGFPTIFLAAMQSEDSDIVVTREQITWISSINLLMVPLGCLFSGPLSHYLGRKRTMLAANIPFITAWLILYFSTTAPWTFIALGLTGLTGGLCEAPVLTYVAEITQPHLRGMLSATSSMAVIIGVFTQLLAGSLTDWRTTTLINISYPILCFVALLMMPESPYWLAGRDRISEAEKSLQWLRGWTSASHVREELQTVCQMVKNPVLDNNSEKTNRWQPFRERTFLLPFILMIITFFIASFGGASTLQTYAVYIFNEMNAPIDRYTATVFLGIAEILGTGICVIVIHFTGKRLLSFISVSGTGISLLSCATYRYLINHENIDTDMYTWIPTTFIISAAFFAHICIRLLPWILVGEVFPAAVRSAASGACAATSYIFASIANKIFLYMVDGMDLSGTFMFYAMINIFGGIVLFFILPETEGRTLKEIEDHYAGVRNLRIKPHTKQEKKREIWASSNPALVPDDVESKI